MAKNVDRDYGGLLRRGHVTQDRSRKLLAVAITLNLPSISRTDPPYRRCSQIPADQHDPLAGVTAGNEKGELVLGVMALDYFLPPCWPPVYALTAVKFDRRRWCVYL